MFSLGNGIYERRMKQIRLLEEDRKIHKDKEENIDKDDKKSILKSNEEIKELICELEKK